MEGKVATGPKMDPRMQEFLGNFGETKGMSLRAAAEWCIAFVMADPENAKHLPEGDALPIEEGARTEWRTRFGSAAESRAKPPEKPARVRPAKLTPPAPPPPPKKEKKVKATRAADGQPPANDGPEPGSYIKTKPTAVTIGSEAVDVSNWRRVYVSVAEALISDGNGDKIPDAYFKEDEQRAKRVSKLSDGRHLYANLTADQVVPRIRTLCAHLGRDVAVTYEQKDGSTKTVTYR